MSYNYEGGGRKKERELSYEKDDYIFRKDPTDKGTRIEVMLEKDKKRI